MESVKRLQIMIPVEMDIALEQRARAEGVSKAELIRRYVGERIRPLPPLEEDPIWELIGIADRLGEDTGIAGDSTNVDDIVYPR
jgi:Ribbon-helix-helix protein, copG family